MRNRNQVKFSIIVPVKKISRYLKEELIPALRKQTRKDFEVIILPDKKEKADFPSFVRIIPTFPRVGPADKRDIGAKNARGEILVFIDDDAYPQKDWLKNALPYFADFKVAAVCGPGVTPPNDGLLAQVSGWVWATPLGAGGAGTYRCIPGKKREVDDFPTFNLFVRKKDFEAVGGFDSRFWPGEDTKLCHDLVYKLGKKIIYDPKVLVFHHRRNIFIPHLRQIGRYGLHRGHFVRILPKTSRRLRYFVPSLFFLSFVGGPVVSMLAQILGLNKLGWIILLGWGVGVGIYLILLLLTGIIVALKSRNALIGILVMPAILITHLFYGLMFLVGLSKKRLKSKYSRKKI